MSHSWGVVDNMMSRQYSEKCKAISFIKIKIGFQNSWQYAHLHVKIYHCIKFQENGAIPKERTLYHMNRLKFPQGNYIYKGLNICVKYQLNKT